MLLFLGTSSSTLLRLVALHWECSYTVREIREFFMTSMHITHQQEAFSRAYVHAVSAAAGFRVQGGTDPDDDSVDLTIAHRGRAGTLRSPKLDVQLKCKLGSPGASESWGYDLKAKNFEELRSTDFMVPRILVVVAVPHDVGTWVDQNEERMLLRHCGWWVSLYDSPRSSNEHTVRVLIPYEQRFDVAGLKAIMSRLGNGGRP